MYTCTEIHDQGLCRAALFVRPKISTNKEMSLTLRDIHTMECMQLLNRMLQISKYGHE